MANAIWLDPFNSGRVRASTPHPAKFARLDGDMEEVAVGRDSARVTEAAPSDAIEHVEAAGLVVGLPLHLLDMSAQGFRAWLAHAWSHVLTAQDRAALQGFLPSSSSNDDVTGLLKNLFRGESFLFGSPIDQFHERVVKGLYHPRVVAVRSKLAPLEK